MFEIMLAKSSNVGGLMGILNFLSSNKLILVGAVATLSEIIVIIVNTYRKLRFNSRIKPFGLERKSSAGSFSTISWVINPVNLFRKP